jgi:hypothetical protein
VVEFFNKRGIATADECELESVSVVTGRTHTKEVE